MSERMTTVEAIRLLPWLRKERPELARELKTALQVLRGVVGRIAVAWRERG